MEGPTKTNNYNSSFILPILSQNLKELGALFFYYKFGVSSKSYNKFNIGES